VIVKLLDGMGLFVFCAKKFLGINSDRVKEVKTFVSLCYFIIEVD